MQLIESTNVDAPIALRDPAILELLNRVLRRGELASLDLTEVDLASATVFVRFGKRGRSRIVPLGEGAIAALVAYLTRARLYLMNLPHRALSF